MAGTVIVGVDENGLGPRLGPLVVTAITVRATGEGERLAQRAPGRRFARVGDSKALVSYKDSTLGEAWARVLLARLGRAARTPTEVVHGLSLDERPHLRALCPGAHEAQCWGDGGEGHGADPALVKRVEKDLTRLEALGIVPVDVRSVILCTRRLNDAAAAGTSRFDVDLHAMERLVLAARETAGEELFATCGKVGGYNQYSPAFGPLAGRLHVTLEEGRKRSEYRFPGLGNVAFLRDADASHLVVAMASLVGKWLRDVLMARVIRYHRAEDGALPEASGYHDPVTARFVDGSALNRKNRELPDVCFERRATSRGAT
jgi:ribonuclease HII